LKYGGNPLCPYIERDVWMALELASRIIYEKFPDRPDRTMWLGDACPYTGGCGGCSSWRENGGRCGGHPHGSHSYRRSIDLNYYTLVGFDRDKGLWGNITQYAPKGLSTTHIWANNNPGEMRLKPGVFDAERNYHFAVTLKKILGIDPAVNYGTQDILKAEMVKYAKTRDEMIFFNHRCSETTGLTYNHHTHVHMVLKNPRTWSYINLKPWL